MLGEVAPLLQEVAAWCIALTAVLAFLAVVCRTRLCRWLFATLITEPVTHWLRREVEEVVAPIRSDVEYVRAEVTLNGGKSLKDTVTRIERHIGIGQ